MIYENGKATGVKIAYVGGGSQGWAWGLMSDLAENDLMSGDVYLYDIDKEAARRNEIIGNRFNDLPGARSTWHYHASESAREAMTNADFVVISILPGTFDEMESDVHTPEKYGIYQSVGDTSGPGGILRAMRTVPMYEVIAGYVRDYCPRAWVISYTNPMTLCVKTLYRVFPEIRAFGCCHEVFGTQKVLMHALKAMRGITVEKREDIKVNPVAVNHFTWLTEATYQNTDLFPIYREFAEKYAQSGYTVDPLKKKNNPFFACDQKVKFDLFLRYGYIAAAGDRHLAEFCPGKWYLESPHQVREWGFDLTPVAWRKERQAERLQESHDYCNGTKTPQIKCTGEEGVHQMQALLGLSDLVTNVNIPNRGQIPNLPLGAVVETNAVFRSHSLVPVMAGAVPSSVYPLVSRICGQQEALDAAIAARDMDAIFSCFINDPLVTCSRGDAEKLFCEMVENTKEYLADYDLSAFGRS